MTLRPALRPGAPLLRRDARHLQVGTSPGVVVPDRPGLMAFLRLLDGVRDTVRLEALARDRAPELTDVPGVLAELMALGAVVDAGASSGSDRFTDEIAVHGGPGCADLVATTRSILAASGLTRLDATEPALLVLMSCGEPARTHFDRASLWGIDHLPVVVDEDRVRIGPLVQPGRTPCVGCYDLHRADFDQAWPALLHQLGRPGTGVSSSALAATTAHAAAVEVAAEVLAHLDGRRARSVGQCLLVGPDHDERLIRGVPFHPRCACDLLNAA